MSEAALNRLLAILLVAVFGSGLLTLRAGAPDSWPLYAFHGISGGVLLAASLLKLRRSLPRAVQGRRWRRLALAAPLVALVLASLVIGFAWTLGGRLIEVGPWTLLGWHGTLGWAALGFAVAHLLLWGRWRLLRPTRRWGARLSRRSALAASGLIAAGLAVWGVAELADRLATAPRRFTGSRWLPSGGIPPPTTFLADTIPAIDPSTWRLRVHGAVDRPVELSTADLQALGKVDLRAVLDCTGGWAMETTWHGVPMSAVLDAAGVSTAARLVNVKSVTGWEVAVPIAEARAALLATGVAGVDLPVANGAPCRLVAPDRRGVDWVKWVSEISVS